MVILNKFKCTWALPSLRVVLCGIFVCQLPSVSGIDSEMLLDSVSVVRIPLRLPSGRLHGCTLLIGGFVTILVDFLVDFSVDFPVCLGRLHLIGLRLVGRI
jgi:hypothetical protein